MCVFWLAALQKYAKLSLSIFTANPPVDPTTRTVACPNRECRATVRDWWTSCPTCNTNFPGCVFTGRSIMDHRYYKCPDCRSKAYEHKLTGKRNCALCHSPLSYN